MVSAPSTPFAKPMSREIMGHKKKVHSVAWNSVGRKLASGSVDQSARVFDVEHGVQAGKEIELKGHSDSVDQVSWDPTAVDRLATISADKSLRLWDIRAGSRCVANVAMSGENINVNWHPDGTCLAVGNRDDVVSFVDARTHKVTRTEKYPYEVNEIAWDASGDVFYLTTGLGTVEVLAYPELTHLHTIRAHTAGLYCMAFDASRPRMALGSADALVSLWDLDEFTCLRTFSRLSWPVRTVSFSHDGRFLASASEDLCVDVADAEDGTCAYRIPTRAAMNSVRWSPTEYLLATRGRERGEGRSRGVLESGARRDETDRSRDARETRETRERRVAVLSPTYVRPTYVRPTYVRPILRSSYPTVVPRVITRASPRHLLAIPRYTRGAIDV